MTARAPAMLIIARERHCQRTLDIICGKFQVSDVTKNGNSFFSLPKCKVVFVRWYLTCKVVPYKKILVENERPYKKLCSKLFRNERLCKKPCKVAPYM